MYIACLSSSTHEIVMNLVLRLLSLLFLGEGGIITFHSRENKKQFMYFTKDMPNKLLPRQDKTRELI